MQFYFQKSTSESHLRQRFFYLPPWTNVRFFQNKLENTSACLSVIIPISEWDHMCLIYFLEILRARAFVSSWVTAEADYLAFLEDVSCPGQEQPGYLEIVEMCCALELVKEEQCCNSWNFSLPLYLIGFLHLLLLILFF